ncbi:MAG TPA: DUF5615 family PIN-like protein [Chloroflexia bacterium]|nr:DUF5615 family PIN-like protein [Chloroflexia bacterium]
MRIVADEGVEHQVVERLRQAGHQVTYVAELHPGITDQEVLSLTESNVAVLLTLDKDFGEMTYRHRYSAPGIVLARLHALTAEQKASVMAAVFAEHGEELAGAFTVVSAGSIRIRPHRSGSKEQS